MKRPVAGYWTDHIELSEAAQGEIRAVLKDESSAAAFIQAIGKAIASYPEVSAAWDGPTPKKIRESINALAIGCRSLLAQVRAIDDLTEEHIREAQVFEGTYGQPTLGGLRDDLGRLLRACDRAAALPDLNRGQGNIGDDARHYLIRLVAAAYKLSTGRTPSNSRSGSFAKLLPIVLKAAGADPGVSHDLLKKIIR